MRAKIMRNIISYTLMLLVTLAHTSCKKQEILYDCPCTTSAKLPITTDWSKTNSEPQNITVLFYNDSDGSLALEHNYEHNAKEIHSSVYLALGSYTVVLFNELRNEIKYLNVRGHENLSTLGFYVNENTDIQAPSTALKYIHEPGMLSLKTIRNLVVTPELVAYTHDIESVEASDITKSMYKTLLDIKPEKKVCLLNIKTHIKGLNNARMPALVDIQNIAGAYMVAGDVNDTAPVTLQLTMNNRTYDKGSTTEGTISTTIALFGFLGDRNSTEDQPLETPIMLNFLFMLVDKEKTLIRQKVNVTDLISFHESLSGLISLSVDVQLKIPLPDVEPEGSGDSGFGSSIGDWGIIDVPL